MIALQSLGTSPFSGGSSPWSHTGQITDNMLEDQSDSEEEEKPEEALSKIEDDMLENEEASSNHLLEQLEENSGDEHSGNTLEIQEGVKMMERKSEGEEADAMKKASDHIENRDNIENSGNIESVEQSLGWIFQVEVRW